MPEVELTKIISVSSVADEVFRQTIDIDFIPDEMIVRSISYYNDGTEGTVGYIWTDLVDGNILGTYLDSITIHCPGTRFIIKKPIRGVYTFQMRNLQNEINLLIGGELLIILEFVKYKQKGKVY